MSVHDEGYGDNARPTLEFESDFANRFRSVGAEGDQSWGAPAHTAHRSEEPFMTSGAGRPGQQCRDSAQFSEPAAGRFLRKCPPISRSREDQSRNRSICRSRPNLTTAHMRVRALSRKAPRCPVYQAMRTRMAQRRPTKLRALRRETTPPQISQIPSRPSRPIHASRSRRATSLSRKPGRRPIQAKPILGRATSRKPRSSRAVRLRAAEPQPARRPTSLSRTDPSRSPVSPIASSRRKPSLSRTLPSRASPIRTTRCEFRDASFQMRASRRLLPGCKLPRG